MHCPRGLGDGRRGEGFMPLHTQVDASIQDDELDVNPVYVQELGAGIPRYRLPAHGMLPRTALQVVRDELILDGNARLNLATFVTTWMEPEAEPGDGLQRPGVLGEVLPLLAGRAPLRADGAGAAAPARRRGRGQVRREHHRGGRDHGLYHGRQL